MIRTVAAGLAVLLLSHAPARAQRPSAPPEGLTVYVLGQLNSFYDDVEDPTNRPEVFTAVPEDVIRPVEINHDGKTDWLIAWPQSTQSCGTGGCRTTLYVSSDFGFTRALDRQVLDDLRIGEVGGEVRMEAWVHHLNCIDDRRECRYAWAWDDTAGRLVPRPASDGITLLSGAGVTVIDYWTGEMGRAQDSWPSELGNQWDASRLICITEGAQPIDIRHADIATVPDLNDDGRPDWVVTPPSACDYQEGPSAFQVWASTGERGERDEVALAYTAGPGAGLRLDLAPPKPALLIPTEICAAVECEWTPLRWNASTKTLTE